MNKGTKYTLVSLGILLTTALVLFILVGFDEKEHAFYSSGGIVYFSQYFILSAGTLALFFSLAGTWQRWMQPVNTKTWAFTMFVHLPLTVLTVLLTFAGLLFLTFV